MTTLAPLAASPCESVSAAEAASPIATSTMKSIMSAFRMYCFKTDTFQAEKMTVCNNWQYNYTIDAFS
jgi:hypothetical protein